MCNTFSSSAANQGDNTVLVAQIYFVINMWTSKSHIYIYIYIVCVVWVFMAEMWQIYKNGNLLHDLRTYWTFLGFILNMYITQKEL